MPQFLFPIYHCRQSQSGKLSYSPPPILHLTIHHRRQRTDKRRHNRRRIIPAGFTLPYCCRYAIILTGISCKEEIFKIRNVHISLLATLPFFHLPLWAVPRRSYLSCSPFSFHPQKCLPLPEHTPASPAPPPTAPMPPSP